MPTEIMASFALVLFCLSEVLSFFFSFFLFGDSSSPLLYVCLSRSRTELKDVAVSDHPLLPASSVVLSTPRPRPTSRFFT